MHFRKQLFACAFICCAFIKPNAQPGNNIVIHFDVDSVYQTMRNFGASNAWSCQFVGNWPDEKKDKIADWLFSLDTFTNGNPKGIGLSLWRYNLGAGSAEQGNASEIKDEWRRAALTTAKTERGKAQNWFLKAAEKRGVQQFLGFFNSPPVQFTKNKKAFADNGICNIDSSNYAAFANYTAKAINQIKDETGISFNYISPVNEPQWDWSDGGQEGCPYTNIEIAQVIKAFNKSFQQNNISTKLVITESGNLKYLLPASDKKDKDNQVNDFFNPASSLFIGKLSNITNAIAAHSYFTTSPFNEAVALRTLIKDSISKIKNLEYWQSEYCILGSNNGEINGYKRDTGITAALYLAKVIYEDVVYANAAAWQWWLAISPYNYKDGLIYIDKQTTNGNFYDSKMLWALGNYSRFIRPGMQRIKVEAAADSLYVSGFTNVKQDKLVFILVNTSAAGKNIVLSNNKILSNKKVSTYTTSAAKRLEKEIKDIKNLKIPAKSIVTLLYEF